MDKESLEERIKQGTLTKDDIFLSRRSFMGVTIKGLVALLALKTIGCESPIRPPDDNGGFGLITAKSYDGSESIDARIETDAGIYQSGDLVEYVSNPAATVSASGYITRTTRVGNKDLLMIPDSEDMFYSNTNIAKDGTHKFAKEVKVYVDGPQGTDYTNAQNRFGIVAGSTVPYSFVGSENTANFIILLNQSTTSHAENIKDGIINKTIVKLEPGAYIGEIDEEIAQGLTHVGNSTYGIPSDGSSCIAGSGQGWNEGVDRKILNAFYNRDYSKFPGNNTETEKM